MSFSWPTQFTSLDNKECIIGVDLAKNSDVTSTAKKFFDEFIQVFNNPYTLENYMINLVVQQLLSSIDKYSYLFYDFTAVDIEVKKKDGKFIVNAY